MMTTKLLPSWLIDTDTITVVIALLVLYTAHRLTGIELDKFHQEC